MIIYLNENKFQRKLFLLFIGSYRVDVFLVEDKKKKIIGKIFKKICID